MNEQLDPAIQELYRRAATDQDLRARLKADVRATLRDEVGLDVPPGIEIEVIEETADKVVLVLPRLPSAGELSDAELDKAAGGFWSSSGKAAGGFWSLSGFRTRLSAGTGMVLTSTLTYRG